MLNGSLHPDDMILITLIGIAYSAALVVLGALLDKWRSPGEPLWFARFVLRAPGAASRLAGSASERVMHLAAVLARLLHLRRT
ncbi:MAG: hypothetical protein HYU77_16785 [Betaproteobacteria bacterium]|nr:hypothetical protein [Betaproteobacteria bacterium]